MKTESLSRFPFMPTLIIGAIMFAVGIGVGKVSSEPENTLDRKLQEELNLLHIQSTKIKTEKDMDVALSTLMQAISQYENAKNNQRKIVETCIHQVDKVSFKGGEKLDALKMCLEVIKP